MLKRFNFTTLFGFSELWFSKSHVLQETNIKHLVSLTALDLSFNSVESIPDEFAALVNLRELSLHSNGIADLSNLRPVKKLTVLNVGA